MDGTVPENEVKRMIAESYDLVTTKGKRQVSIILYKLGYVVFGASHICGAILNGGCLILAGDFYFVKLKTNYMSYYNI